MMRTLYTLTLQLIVIFTTASATDQVIEGRLSSSRDDAQSRATCPEGLVVTYCEVKTGLVHTKSDGAFVDPSSNGRACVAVNGGGGSGAVALAKCSGFLQHEKSSPFQVHQPALPRSFSKCILSSRVPADCL